MTLVIVAIILIGYILIATGNITNVNKAAVAMFAGTVGWVLYICYGTDFVMSQHPREYVDFLAGIDPTGASVKQFVAQNIFLKYRRMKWKKDSLNSRDCAFSAFNNDNC